MTSSDDAPVLIVGAGTSGLALAHELMALGIRPRVVDRAARVAERWRRRHPQLRLNTHKLLSHLPGRRFDRNVAVFPSRDDFVGYVEAYERALGIDIVYGVRVSQIERNDTGWRAESDTGPLTARDLVVATGPDNVPVIPDWPGRDAFTGAIIHAADFGRAEDYDGKRILLVGAGNSSVDVANHLTNAAPGPMWMSVRRGATVVPQYVLGLPTHLLTPLMRLLPVPVVDATIRMISRWFCGDLTKRGLPAPEMGALSRVIADGASPAIDGGFAGAVRTGRIAIVPEIERFDGDAIRLRDGQVLTPDVVICGTGISDRS